MKKHYTLTEYCRRFAVDTTTRRKMTKISLLQQRTAGEKGFTRGARLPLEFWKELHSKADNTSSIPSLFLSVPGYLRKAPAMKGVDPETFYAFMKARYRAYKSRARHGDAFDDLVFLLADLQAGASCFLYNPEGHAPQKRQGTPAPEPNNTCTCSGNSTQGSISITVPEKGTRMAFPAAEGNGLLGFVLGGLSGAVVAVVCSLFWF